MLRRGTWPHSISTGDEAEHELDAFANELSGERFAAGHAWHGLIAPFIGSSRTAGPQPRDVLRLALPIRAVAGQRVEITPGDTIAWVSLDRALGIVACHVRATQLVVRP